MPCTASAMPRARLYRGGTILTSLTSRTMRSILKACVTSERTSWDLCSLPPESHVKRGMAQLSTMPETTISMSKRLPPVSKKLHLW